MWEKNSPSMTGLIKSWDTCLEILRSRKRSEFREFIIPSVPFMWLFQLRSLEIFMPSSFSLAFSVITAPPIFIVLGSTFPLFFLTRIKLVFEGFATSLLDDIYIWGHLLLVFQERGSPYPHFHVNSSYLCRQHNQTHWYSPASLSYPRSKVWSRLVTG